MGSRKYPKYRGEDGWHAESAQSECVAGRRVGICGNVLLLADIFPSFNLFLLRFPSGEFFPSTRARWSSSAPGPGRGHRGPARACATASPPRLPPVTPVARRGTPVALCHLPVPCVGRGARRPRPFPLPAVVSAFQGLVTALSLRCAPGERSCPQRNGVLNKSGVLKRALFLFQLPKIEFVSGINRI